MDTIKVLLVDDHEGFINAALRHFRKVRRKGLLVANGKVVQRSIRQPRMRFGEQRPDMRAHLAGALREKVLPDNLLA